MAIDLWPFDEGGIFGEDEDGNTNPVYDLVRGGVRAIRGLGKVGKTDFRATVPPNLRDGTLFSSAFPNPSAPTAGGGLRETLVQQYGQAPRPAPIAQHAVAQKVAPAERSIVAPIPPAARSMVAPIPPAMRSTLDLGLLAPGAAVTTGALMNSEGTRELQRLNLGGLADAAAGAVPSAAEAQMRTGLGRALRQNLALAASARGTNASRVAAQRAATDANALASADVLGQTAALRAAEQAQARQLLTGALEGIRAGDFQAASTGLGLGQIGLGAAQAQLGADTQTQLGNLQAGTQLALGQLGADVQTQLANLQAGTQLALGQLSSDTQTQLANLQAKTGIALGQLNADQATQLANLDAQLKSQGMDDAHAIATLGAILQIDANTMEGQMALQQLLAEAHIKTQAINAAIATNNAQAGVQLLGAGLGTIGDLGAAAIA
jgi:hypothetical protein